MEPGPLSIGMASGENAMSRSPSGGPSAAPAVRRSAAAVSMLEPMPATISPPAIRSPGIEIPKKPMINDPPTRNVTSTATMKTQAARSWPRRRCGVMRSVSARKAGADAGGLVTGSRARTVPMTSSPK